MRTHGIGEEVAKDDGSGIVGSICVYFANESLVLDVKRTERGGGEEGGEVFRLLCSF